MPSGFLKITLWAYPSQIRFDLTQLPHVGFSSPHLMRRFRHAVITIYQNLKSRDGEIIFFRLDILRQPVLVRFFGSLRDAGVLTSASTGS